MPSTRLQNYTIHYQNSQEYHSLKRELFTGDLYYFETNNPQPFIIDAGAHIGLASLYFKQLYPHSEILAIEPNPISYQLLERNIFENQLDNITTINAALSDQTGKETFYLDKTDDQWYSTAGFHQGSWVGNQQSKKITVSSYTLNEFINKPVDFLKLDIEAAEQKVLLKAQGSLNLIRELQLEFHPHKTQSIQKIIEILTPTHTVEVYKGTTLVPEKKINRTKGLLQLRAVLRPSK